jgi:hypothetical protein
MGGKEYMDEAEVSGGVNAGSVQSPDYQAPFADTAGAPSPVLLPPGINRARITLPPGGAPFTVTAPIITPTSTVIVQVQSPPDPAGTQMVTADTLSAPGSVLLVAGLIPNAAPMVCDILIIN